MTPLFVYLMFSCVVRPNAQKQPSQIQRESPGALGYDQTNESGARFGRRAGFKSRLGVTC